LCSLFIDNEAYDNTPVRANSALARYFNSTIADKPSMEYEVPISSKDSLAPPTSPPRGKLESMYVSMDSATVEQAARTPELVDSMETDHGNERYSIHRVRALTLLCCIVLTLCIVQRPRKADDRDTSAVFDIYRSFGPDNEIYCQFMEEV